jgi:hypothetical protein
VPYRILTDNQKFRRWDWISYDFIDPVQDLRRESQKVIPESIQFVRNAAKSARFKSVQAAIRYSLEDALARKESLTLIQPRSIEFRWRKKTNAQLQAESEKHKALSQQASFFDQDAKPFGLCPYTFYVFWIDVNGKPHRHTCDDWETSTAFFVRRNKLQSDIEALQSLKATYERDYMAKGLVLGFSTHSRRVGQWLLVAIIRVDIDTTKDLFAY